MKRKRTCPKCSRVVDTDKEHYRATIRHDYGFVVCFFHIHCFKQDELDVVDFQYCYPEEWFI